MKKRFLKKGFAFGLGLALSVTTLANGALSVTAYAAETRTVNINDNGTIAGINNPEPASSAKSSWSNGNGSYIYFGNYYINSTSGKEPIIWRVLDVNNDADSNGSGDSYLVLADKVMDSVLWDPNEDNYDPYTGICTWQYCNLNLWMNSKNYKDDTQYHSAYTSGGFLNAAFVTVEQDALSKTTKGAAGTNPVSYKNSFGITYTKQVSSDAITGEKVFIPSIAEIKTPKYGFFNNSSSTDATTSIIFGRTKYAGSKSAGPLNSASCYTLRGLATNGLDIGYVSNYGAFNTSALLSVSTSYHGILPSCNITKSSVLFTKDYNSTFSTFGSTSTSSSNKWTLVIKDGNNSFRATRNGNDTISFTGGQIKLTGISGATTGTNASNQISALIVDSNNSVISYGKIANANVSEATVNIPSLASGVYTLKVFSEQANTNGATSYASNMVSIPFAVGYANVEPPKDPDPVDTTLYGDLNNDSKIDSSDSVLLKQYLADYTEVKNSINMKAADVDCNGTIDAVDAVVLAKYLAGYDITLGK